MVSRRAGRGSDETESVLPTWQVSWQRDSEIRIDGRASHRCHILRGTRREMWNETRCSFTRGNQTSRAHVRLFLKTNSRSLADDSFCTNQGSSSFVKLSLNPDRIRTNKRSPALPEIDMVGEHQSHMVNIVLTEKRETSSQTTRYMLYTCRVNFIQRMAVGRAGGGEGGETEIRRCAHARRDHALTHAIRTVVGYLRGQT